MRRIGYGTSLLVLMLTTALWSSVAAAGMTSMLYYDGSWKKMNLNDQYYVSLAADNRTANVVLGAKDGGGLTAFEGVGGSVTMTDLGSSSYVQVVSDSSETSLNHLYYALTSSGEVDVVYKTGGAWSVARLYSGTNYTYLEPDSQYNRYVYAAKAGGGLDVLYDSSGWKSGQISANTYVELKSDPMNGAYCYALTPTGNIDVVYNSGSWGSGTINSGNNYTTITQDGTEQTRVYGVNTAGTDIVYSSGGWTSGQVSTEAFSALVPEPSTYAYLYGIEADGDIGRIYYDNAYITDTILAGGGWKTIEADHVNSGQIYISSDIPEPTTLAVLLMGGLLFRRKR